MKRDALPQHEIDVIVRRLKNGERLVDIYRSMHLVVEERWFEVNAESLYKLAGVDPARDEQLEDLDDVLDAPEPAAPAEPEPAAPAEPEPVVDEEAPPPLSEEERKVAREEMAKLEAEARAADPAPEKGRKHGKR